MPTSLIVMGGQCPGPSITSISPESGPRLGGTVITINGQNLGVIFSDFNASNSIILSGNGANVECVPLSDGYISGALVHCRTMPVPSEGMYTLLVTLKRSSGPQVGMHPFAILLPTIASANPLLGPIAGGTSLTITGTNLNTGLNAVVRLNGETGPTCVLMEVTKSMPTYFGVLRYKCIQAYSCSKVKSVHFDTAVEIS